MDTLITGFIISISLIVSIGAQNAFLLRQGLLRRHVLPVVLICCLGDLLLIGTGVLGLGAVFNSNPTFTRALAVAGIVFLIYLGTRSIRAAFTQGTLDVDENGTAPQSRKAVISTALAVTFLNPQSLLETLVIIGSLAATFTPEQKARFLLGAVSASFLWFFSLGYGARLLRPLFKKRIAWQLLDIGTGLLMFYIAWHLADYFFLK
ncbi:MAG: LysE family transporter [Lautropia sp.]|nr:LysE family transporter [Lautropia sp.]